jgi:hypothetical protein
MMNANVLLEKVLLIRNAQMWMSVQQTLINAQATALALTLTKTITRVFASRAMDWNRT